MWTADNRPRYNRETNCVRSPASDLTDAEWAHSSRQNIAAWAKPFFGAFHKRCRDRYAGRAVINGVMYILSTGSQFHRRARCPRICQQRRSGAVHDYLGDAVPNWLARRHAAIASRSLGSCRSRQSLKQIAARKPRAKPAPRPASSTLCRIQSVKSAEKGWGWHRQPRLRSPALERRSRA